MQVFYRYVQTDVVVWPALVIADICSGRVVVGKSLRLTVIDSHFYVRIADWIFGIDIGCGGTERFPFAVGIVR